MALSEKNINEQIVATVEGLVSGIPANANEEEATQYLIDTRRIVDGVLATINEILDSRPELTIH